MEHFYSRPCGRGDLQGVDGYVDQLDFYSRPCGRGDLVGAEFADDRYDFYSRPCGRGDDHAGQANAGEGDFYSRPCGRGDKLYLCGCLSAKISTHAPAGGATILEYARSGIAPISTHAPAGGATPLGLFAALVAQISTHAPAGGATEKNEIVRGGIKFLLTPLREGRLEAMSKVKRKPPNFYSRPCGRGDAAALVCNRQIPFYFYSRPCGRGDVFFQREEAVFHISTHAPAGGATSRIYYVDAASYISTHAPAGGATVAFAMARTVQSPFLLTPLREGRHRKHAIFDRKLDFYSRPCGRGDASRKWSAPLPILISTHAPAGGATISNNGSSELVVFLLTPLREGRPKPFAIAMLVPYFYSRPCGRGDAHGRGEH